MNDVEWNLREAERLRRINAFEFTHLDDYADARAALARDAGAAVLGPSTGALQVNAFSADGTWKAYSQGVPGPFRDGEWILDGAAAVAAALQASREGAVRVVVRDRAGEKALELERQSLVFPAKLTARCIGYDEGVLLDVVSADVRRRGDLAQARAAASLAEGCEREVRAAHATRVVNGRARSTGDDRMAVLTAAEDLDAGRAREMSRVVEHRGSQARLDRGARSRGSGGRGR